MKVDDVCLWEAYEYVKDCPLVRLTGRFEQHEGLGLWFWTAEDLETREIYSWIDERHLQPLTEMEVLAWVTKRVDERGGRND